jgi:hypothetical protein
MPWDASPGRQGRAPDDVWQNRLSKISNGVQRLRPAGCRIRCDAARLARFSHSNMKL